MITVKNSLYAALAVVLTCLATSGATAVTGAHNHGHGGCNACSGGCGHYECDCQCNTVCQPTIEMKEVEEVYWECECKTVCLVGPSCGCKGTCAGSRQVKHLIRKVRMCEVPVVKCNAVEGAACGCGAGAPAVVPETEAPAAPMPAAPAPPAAKNNSLGFDAFTMSNPVGNIILSSRRTAAR